MNENTTIRHGIVEAMNDIANLIYKTTDPMQLHYLKTQYNQLYSQLNDVLFTDMTAVFNSKVYLDAVKGLNVLSQQAKQATNQINHTAQVIQTAANVIGKIAQIFAFLASLGVMVG